ncbi:MAG: trimethylamine methyltransferase family protein [Butyricicoccus sp.]
MSREQMIHDAAMQILRDVGVKVHNQKALEIFRQNGVKVEDSTVFLTEEQVWHWVKMAPSAFTILGRNPKYKVEMGTGKTNPAPAYGCAFIAEKDGTQRPGMMDDYMKCLKLVYANEDYDINGGTMIQPSDVPDRLAPLAMFYATILNSDKAIMLSTGDKDVMEHLMEASCELFGGKDALIAQPRMIALINTNSPLSLDERMVDNLMVLAEYGQPVILCPAAMLGATGPLPMAGTLASGTAEDLTGICLAQMVRPGTPVVFGIQSTAVDMRGLTFACAAPEGAQMQGFAANMGKFYDLPSRGGGSQTDAPVLNAQAGYESMLTFYSAYSHGVNIVMEAGGIVDSVNATSFEKMIADFEVIRLTKAALTPFEVNEETLDLDEIREAGHTGSFVTMDYTLDNFMDLYMPNIGGRGAKTKSPTYYEDSIEAEMNRLLDEFEDSKPELDREKKDRVKAVLVKSGMDASILDKIEAM